jgi:hypothetical protein
MPYLRDERQDVARAYGAKTTSDCFVIDADGRIAYRGAPDADYADPSHNATGQERRATRQPHLPCDRRSSNNLGISERRVSQWSRSSRAWS